jgi:lysine-specific demethylase 8
MDNEMSLRSTTVEIRTLVTVEEFEAYVRPGGKPVIIRGWMNNWKALSAWDFDFFKTGYGDDRLRLRYVNDGRSNVLDVTMAEYIDYIISDDDGLPLRKLQRQHRLSEPFYCLTYKPFAKHPELVSDFRVPPFVADWGPFFSASFARAHFPHVQGWVLISPKGGVSRLHQDSHHTITWLAQVRGTKACYLFAPGESDAVYRGEIDPVLPDPEKYPLLREATCHHCVLSPGDMLFLPPDWWHHVVTLDNSVTISYNFVNHTNFGLYIGRVFGARLPDFLASMPAIPGAKLERGQPNPESHTSDLRPAGGIVEPD